MKEEHKGDVFRESILRYTAFASDFGEALKPFIGTRLYLGSYAIVAAYGLADTADRGVKAYLKNRKTTPTIHKGTPRRPLPNKNVVAAMHPLKSPTLSPVSATVIESLMWHTAASLVIPGVIINRTVWATTRAMAAFPTMSHTLRHTIPTLAGLATIPLIVPHIDEAVSTWMAVNVAPKLAEAVAAGKRKEKEKEKAQGNRKFMRAAHS